MTTPISRRQFLKRALIGGGAALLASYPFFIERNLVGINRYRIPVPHLPLAFRGFTIAHLTDLHYGRLVSETMIRSVVQRTNQQGADCIVCTGDYVHELNHTRQIDEVWPLMQELEAPQGVYAVLGNHDHWADTERSLYWMDKSGRGLRHKAIAFERDGQHLWLGGLGDLREDLAGIQLAFHNVPPEACKIALAHNPDTADIPFGRTRIDLMLCGHTHGGQVRLPFFGAPVLPVKNHRYDSGFIRSEQTNLFISRGIGWTNIPIRLNCPPEIAVLELVPDDPAAG